MKSTQYNNRILHAGAELTVSKYSAYLAVSDMMNAAPAQRRRANDQETAWLGPITPGSSNTLSNSQCTVSGTGTTASGTGTTLRVKVAVTFQPTFTGLQNIYLYAQDVSGANTGFVTSGTWTP